VLFEEMVFAREREREWFCKRERVVLQKRESDSGLLWLANVELQ
jgi:hypothetical protein